MLLVVTSAEVSKEEIYKFLVNKIAKWWMPDDILFLSELPHTATGKIKKVELKRKYVDHLISHSSL